MLITFQCMIFVIHEFLGFFLDYYAVLEKNSQQNRQNWRRNQNSQRRGWKWNEHDEGQGEKEWTREFSCSSQNKSMF